MSVTDVLVIARYNAARAVGNHAGAFCWATVRIWLLHGLTHEQIVAEIDEQIATHYSPELRREWGRVRAKFGEVEHVTE